MRTKLHCLWGIMLCFQTFAQKTIPSFGKIDKADLEMTECSFDKGAAAVKLIHTGNMTYARGVAGYSDFKTFYNYRVRIKILNEKGLAYANVEIPFYSHNSYEKVTAIDGHTFNLDENGKVKETNVSKSSIYLKKITKRYSRMVITFPEAKVGSVIEYKYRVERENFTDIQDWYFQDDIPTRYSEYETRVPALFRFSVEPTIVDSIDIKQKVITDVFDFGSGAYQVNVVKKNYIMENLKGIRYEPFMPAAKDYQQHLEFQLSEIDYGTGEIKDVRTTWPSLVKTLNEEEDFGKQLAKDVKGASDLVKQSLQISHLNERMNFIYNNVRNNITSTDDDALFTDEGIEKAWKNKTGNAADINLLLINLLNQAGIKAHPILLSSRDHGLTKKSYPFLSQFNVVMAYVPTDAGYWILDGTDKTSHYKLTPEGIVNTAGFIVSGDAGKWVNVLNNTHRYQMTVVLQGTVSPEGSIKAEGTVNSIDYARKERIDDLKKDEASFKNKLFIAPYSDIKVEEVQFSNSNTDSLALVQKIRFTQPLNTSGEYSYFKTNLFTGFHKNPFLEEERTTDIDFGYQQSYTIYGNYKLPENYSFDALPQNLNMTIPDRSIAFTRVTEVNGSILNMVITIDFKRNFYGTSNYTEFREFYKKIISHLDEQIVLKKKS